INTIFQSFNSTQQLIVKNISGVVPASSGSSLWPLHDLRLRADGKIKSLDDFGQEVDAIPLPSFPVGSAFTTAGTNFSATVLDGLLRWQLLQPLDAGFRVEGTNLPRSDLKLEDFTADSQGHVSVTVYGGLKIRDALTGHEYTLTERRFSGMVSG